MEISLERAELSARNSKSSECGEWKPSEYLEAILPESKVAK